MPAPAAAQRKVKATDYEGRSKPKPGFRSAKEQDQDQASENDLQKYRRVSWDQVDEIIGTNFKQTPWGPDAFRDSFGRKFQVACFYPHKKLAVDGPLTQAEADLKKEALNKIGIGYVYVVPSVPKSWEQIEQEILEALELCKPKAKSKP